MLTEKEVAELRSRSQTMGALRFSKILWNRSDEILDTLEALFKAVRAAQGLSFGTDWNNGNHAIKHGYRKQLLEALLPFQEPRESEGK